jgi:hypothetical protein
MASGYCCLYFARGICHHGADCNYLHRVPSAADEARHYSEPQYDIFGRDRVAETGRTKGVGSYSRECTTLYAYIGGAATLPAATLAQLVRENFAEWGPVDDVTVVAAKAIAFVRYRWRASAEFAKAAMHQQTLAGAESSAVLDVRWANDDPNPRARAVSQRHKEEALAGAYASAVNALDPEAKRARLQQLKLAAAYRPGAVAGDYPDTSAQYGEDAAGGGGGQYSHEYQGWDARAYAEAGPPAAQQDAGGEGGGGGAAAQDAAVERYQSEVYAGRRWQHWPSAPDEGDDVGRYLRQGDRLAAEGSATGAAAAAGDAGDAGAAAEAEDAAAREALELIGGYGSGGDSD